MKVKFSLGIPICLFALTACIPPVPNLTPKLYLHPVKGPSGSQYPGTTITAVSTGITSGSISFQLPSGESCKGQWEPIPQNQSGSGLADSWDLVYGQGYFTKHVLGAKWRGKSKIAGNQRSEFLLEFYRDTSKDAPLLGVATDAVGNIYKVTQ
ncbi:hypothetical protein [Geothrix sp. PMB-07]|uniref:hypothetical protein n=1 Tax=Geothrix sp. PMB-07 TaxID=3068640 RepID=UPI002741C30E|nr:hypothetical protein [Geothrix sp. PMB-07]WLT32321.1 hypothetical protein Q9293_03105 [Geothrix sp. PMB-07]